MLARLSWAVGRQLAPPTTIVAGLFCSTATLSVTEPSESHGDLVEQLSRSENAKHADTRSTFRLATHGRAIQIGTICVLTLGRNQPRTAPATA